MWPPTITDCVCEQPGWCERHRCLKNAQWHLLCRRDEVAFRQWEDGIGPCLNVDHNQATYAELPRCQHRGLEIIEHLECELCGGNRRLIPVYECRLFHRCTEHSLGTRFASAEDVSLCLRCEQYVADGLDATPPDVRDERSVRT